MNVSGTSSKTLLFDHIAGKVSEIATTSTSGGGQAVRMPAITEAMREAGCRTLMRLCEEHPDAGFSDWADEVFTAMWEARR